MVIYGYIWFIRLYFEPKGQPLPLQRRNNEASGSKPKFLFIYRLIDKYIIYLEILFIMILPSLTHTSPTMVK